MSRSSNPWLQELAAHLWNRLYLQLMVPAKINDALAEFEEAHPEIPFPALRPLAGKHGMKFSYEAGSVEILTAGCFHMKIDATGCVVNSHRGECAMFTAP